MSTLLVDSLDTDGILSQEFRISLDTRYNIGAIIPYLYMHGAPAGTFYLGVQKNGSEIFSQSFTCADIKTALDTTDDYAHVFFPIVPNLPLYLEKGIFSVNLYSSGYVSGSSFLGWVKQHENLNNELDYTPVNDLENPLATRFKIYQQGIFI